MIKKLFSTFMAAATICTMSACGTPASTASSSSVDAASPSSSSAAESKPAAPVTLTVGMPASWKDFGGISDILKDWETQTGNKLDVQAVDDAQYVQQLMAKLATDEAYDVIFTYAFSGASQFNPKDNFANLADQPWVANLNEAGKSFMSYDGTLYGAPFCGSAAIGIVYNKDVFAQNGLEIPTTPEEMDAVCKALVAKGITPFFMAGGDNWPIIQAMSAEWPSMWMAQPDLLDRLNSNQVRWDEVPAVTNVFKKLESYVKNGYFNKDAATASYDMSIEAVATGTAAMVYQGAWMAGEIEKKFPGANVGMFAPPNETGDSQIALASCNAMYVYSKGKQQETAKDLINFICQKENRENFYAKKPDISVWKDVTAPQLDRCNADAQVYVNNAKSKPHWNDVYAVTYSEDMNQIMAEMLFGKKTAEEMAKAFSDFCQTAGKQALLPGF